MNRLSSINTRSVVIMLMLIGSAFCIPEQCSSNIDCRERYTCNMEAYQCERDSFLPLPFQDIVGTVIMVILMSLVTTAGIGGGEIVVPVIKILFGFSQMEASPISTCCIMMAGIIRFIVNYNKKHPNKDAVPIDYSAAMVLMPAMFFGSSLGHMLHEILPNLIQEIMLFLVLLFCIFESLKKGIFIWNKESKEIREKREIELAILSNKDVSRIQNSFYESGVVEDSFGQSDSISNLPQTDGLLTPHNDNSTKKALIEEYQQYEKSHWQFAKLVPIWLIFTALIGQSILRDSGLLEITKCGTAYWAIYAGYALCCGSALLYSIIQFRKEVKLKKALFGTQQREGDVVYTNEKIFFLVTIAVCVGAIAAVIGIGGGLLFIPILLILGYSPFVASCTSMFMVMYSASANVISYIIAGKTNIPYGFWLALWTCLGVILGMTTANKILAKTGRQSIFIFLFAIINFLCIIFCVTFNITHVRQEIQEGKNIIEFGSVCG
ncbi:unnamed protein product [Moneuplotes crassus]|uniref:Sulfite exporter TauE/SafE n=1 Tax=Euplotes crassus TaxID=5936 RepID=A0AAD1X636_EUPCR|nr:unnamed protein product [Moneuplotes crassus]